MFRILDLKIKAQSILQDQGVLETPELEQLLDTYGDHISDRQCKIFFYGEQKNFGSILSLDERCFYQLRQNIADELKRKHAVWNIAPWNGEKYTTIDILGFQARKDNSTRPYRSREEDGLFVIDLGRILGFKMGVENPALVVDSLTQEHKTIAFVYDNERIVITRVYNTPFILARNSK